MPRKKNRTGKKRRASAKFLAAGNPWRAHIKETMRKNPNMKFGKSLLKLASKTYKKGQATTPSGEINIRDSKYSVRVRRKKTKKRTSKKTKKRTSSGFFG